MHQASLEARLKAHINAAASIDSLLIAEVLAVNRNIAAFLQDAQLPECSWNPAVDCAGSFFQDLKLPPDYAGIVDGILEEVTGVGLLISMVVDYKLDPVARAQIHTALDEFSVNEAFTNWSADKVEQYSGSPAEKTYQLHKDFVTVVSTFFGAGLGAATKGKKAADVVEVFADGVKRWGDEVAEAGSDWISFLGKNIDDIVTAPKGYTFYTKNGKKWIRQIDASDLNTARLTVKNGKIIKYADEITHPIFKTADELAVTFDKLGEVSQEVRQQAFDLFKEKNWGKLEKLFDVNNINGKWPPNRGFIDFTTNPLGVGKEIDRYGGYIDNTGKFVDKGTFASPKGASFESRALPPGTQNKPYKKYKVIKEIPNVKQGSAIPWFNQSGMGIQYEFNKGINKLLSEGYIIEIP